MIRVMLVDDEAIVRKGIRESIEWEKYDVSIAGEASNGAAALEMIHEVNPDIVITDIRMPLMDGLEFAGKLKEQKPDVKIIILSGYEDFVYAKRALQLGANDYILKPISDEEIVVAITKLKDEIEAERRGKEKITDSRFLLNKNYFHIKSKFIRNLINNQNSSGSARIEAEKLNIRLNGPNYAAFILAVDGSESYFGQLLVEDQELQKYAISNIAEETLMKNNSGVVVSDDMTNQLIGILNTYNTSSNFMDMVCRKIQENVEQFLGISVSIGIGQCCDSLSDLGNAYSQARKALNYKFYMGKKSIHIYNSKKKFKDSGEYVFPIKEERALLVYIKESNEVGLNEVIKKLFARFEEELVEEELVRETCCRLLNTMIGEMENMEIPMGAYIGKSINPYGEIREFEVLEDIFKWFSNLIHKILLCIEDNKKYKSIVLNAIRYMENNYQNDITLADIAGAIHVSPNYFSKLFKDETEVNFIDWLNKLRIEKSLELLKRNDLKIYEVANRVGYADYKYYSALFKKITGLTPKQYKDGQRII